MAYGDYNLFRPYQIDDTIAYLQDNAGGVDVSATVTTLTDLKATLITEIAGTGLDKPCPHCRTLGRYPVTPGDDSTIVQCETCNGIGFTAVQKTAVISGYVDAP